MKISILAANTSRHQVDHAKWIAKGLALHGHEAVITHSVHTCNSDYVVCWGWRNGSAIAARGRQVLVMERGYIGDRFLWTSLGWNGLNARAVMPCINDNTRFSQHHEKLMQPWCVGGDYILLIGQVPGDAALGGRNLSNWYLDTARALESHYGAPVLFRPHPRANPGAYPRGLTHATGSLAEALARARVVVTYNSNTAVEAVLAGKPTLALDKGSMAWDVTGHSMGIHFMGDRQVWASQLAWKQWLPHEIEDGSALAHLLPLGGLNGH